MSREKGRGRPPFEITEEVIKKAEKYASNGLTMQEICQCLGISHQTLNVKRKLYDEFSEAIIRGKAKGIAMMANNLVKLAKKGNAAANIFFMKARAKWKEGDEDNSDILNKANEALNQMRELADRCLKKTTQD